MQTVWFVRLGVVLCAAAWAGALALVLASLAAHGSSLYHDYRDSFPMRFRNYTPLAFAGLTFCLMWGAGIGPAVFLWVVAMLLCPYLPRRGQIALGVCLALGCLFPLGLSWFSEISREPGDRAGALYRVWRGDGDLELDEELRGMFAPTDAKALFARSRVARRSGYYEASAEHLRHGLARGGDEGLFRLELGNVYFLQGRMAEALDEYKLATQARPEDPAPWLNRHLAHLNRLELADADLALERAKAIDSGAVEEFQKHSPAKTGGLTPVSDPLPGRWIRSELLSLPKGHAPPVQALVEGLFVPTRVLRPVYFGFFALVIVFTSLRKGPGPRSHRCPTCGFVVCPRCGRRVKETQLCPACWAASRARDLGSAERDRQSESANQWQARMRRWMGWGRMFLPGWSEYLGPSTVQGLVIGLVWAIAVGYTLVALVYPIPQMPGAHASMPWAAVAVVILTHVFGIHRALAIRQRSRR